MMKNLRKVLLTATLLSAAGTAFADDAAWDFETISEGTEYYIYNVGQKKFLNDNDALVDEGAPTWTVSSNQIKSQNSKYISITSNILSQDRGSGLDYVYKFATYEFPALSSSGSAATSNIDSQTTYYVIGNKVEDYRKTRAVAGTVVETQEHVHYLVANGTSLSATGTAVNDNNGKWLFISKTQYDTKAIEILLNKEKETLNAKISEAQTYLNGISVPANATAALSAAISQAQSVYDNHTISEEAIQGVRDEVTALANVLSTTQSLVGYLNSLNAKISEAQTYLTGISVPATATASLTAEISQAQSVYENSTVSDADIQKVQDETTTLSNVLTTTKSFVGVLGNLSSAISGAQSFLSSCKGTQALKKQLSDKIYEANTLYNSATVDMSSTVNSTIGELSTIQSTITSLVNYYTATVTQVKSGISFLTQDEIDSFNDDLEATVSKNEMLAVAQNLRKMIIARIGTTFVESGSSKDVTALLTNPDFEYGTDEGWYTTDAHRYASSSVVEIGSDIFGAHGKYMLESGQYGIYTDRGRYVYTVLTDLPVGSYVASAQMTSIYTSVLDPKVNLTVIITPASFFGGATSAPRREAGDSGITTEQVVNNISSVMDSSDSTIKTVSLPKGTPTQLNTSHNLAFDVAEPSSVVLVYHSGINDNKIDETGSYRADNLKLAMTANIWTGVDNVIVDSEDAEEVYYDLQGRRVANPERGIYICNGKKVLIK